MIRKNQAFFNRLNQVLDILLVIACYAFSSWIWLVVRNRDYVNMATISGHTLLTSFIYSLALSIFFMSVGFYGGSTRTRKLSWKLKIILIGTTATLLVSSFLLYLFRLQDFSRGVLFIFYGTSVSSLSLKYVAMRYIMKRMREELERRQRAQAASNTGCSVLLAIVVAILLIVMHH